MVDPGKLADIFANEREMERLIDNINKIERGVSAIASRIAGLNADVQTGTESVRKAVDDVTRGLGQASDKMDHLTESSELFFSKWEKAAQRIRGVMQDVGSAAESLGTTMSRLQTSPEATVMHGIRSIPYVGPLLDVAITSQFREDRFKTAGRQAALQMGATSQLDPAQVKRQGEELGADMKRLEESFLATKEDVQSVWGAFADGGAKAVDMVKKVGFEVEGFGRTVPQVALGIDKAFQQASGTTARFATTLTKDTGQSLEQTVTLVKDLGLASYATGLSMQGFVGSILQVTSALRVQGGDARDLANAFLNVQKAFAGAMGVDVKNQHVAELAAGAVGGLPAFIQGMPEGLKALVGMRISREMGINTTDLGALRQMETGFQFAEKGMDNRHFEQRAAEGAFAELSSRIKDPNELFRALMKVGQMPALLAEAMVQTNGKLFTGKEFEKRREEYEGQLKQAKDLEPLKKGDFEKVMKDIENLMHALGQLTIATLQLIVQTLVSGFRMIMPGSGYGFEDFKRDVGARGLGVGDAAGMTAEHLKKLGLSSFAALDLGSFFQDPMKKDVIAGRRMKDVEGQAVEELLSSRKGGDFAAQFRSAFKQTKGDVGGALDLFGGALSQEDRRVIQKRIKDVDDEYLVNITHIKGFQNQKYVHRGDIAPPAQAPGR